MTILLIGGTGTTGLPLARRLHEANHPVLLTSRSRPVPEPFKGVRFDWQDPSTYENPFKAAADIDRIYIVCPQVHDMVSATRPFLELAVSKGVKRFVLLSALGSPQGSHTMGQVHEYIINLGVDYCVIRPAWFIENFGFHYLHAIRNENIIPSATKNGRIPLVGVDDVVDTAFKALVDEKSPNAEQIVVGPELFSYDEAAALLTTALGREIVHKRLTDEESIALFSGGADGGVAEELLQMEKFIADGGEEAGFNAGSEGKVVGHRRLGDYIKANKDLWVSK
ncbi:hypothetical protein H0H87_012056 [Tephrocybe sp. NHM501043]|nr:hypothetical protein H0H87_012056 [Tephrocybe sp. NHM501043]